MCLTTSEFDEIANGVHVLGYAYLTVSRVHKGHQLEQESRESCRCPRHIMTADVHAVQC